MKRIFLLGCLAILVMSCTNCGHKTSAALRYKGRLECAGICLNYTIGLIEGNLDSSLLVASWSNEANNRTYKNVFRLENPCDFPSSIKEGDTFYFTLDSALEECITCRAYYPTPPKSLRIKVVDE